MRQYLIEKRGLYHRPEGRGYTIHKREAGRYPFETPLSEGERRIPAEEAPEYSSGAYPDQVIADLLRQRAALELTAKAWRLATIGTFLGALLYGLLH